MKLAGVAGGSGANSRQKQQQWGNLHDAGTLCLGLCKPKSQTCPAVWCFVSSVWPDKLGVSPHSHAALLVPGWSLGNRAPLAHCRRLHGASSSCCCFTALGPHRGPCLSLPIPCSMAHPVPLPGTKSNESLCSPDSSTPWDWKEAAWWLPCP